MVLKELCALRGVSGDEGRVRDYIRAHVQQHATSVRVDRLGNLIAYKQGSGEDRRHILLSAHMDEVGLVVYGVNESGLLSYRTVGSIDSRAIVSKPVRIGDKETPGVIGAKAIHLQTAEDRTHALAHDQLYIDIGAKDRAAAERLVELGDYISFESKWVEFGDGLVKSRALDDRIGCAVMMSVLENDYPCDVTCVFTVQEEVGQRGSFAAAHDVAFDAAVVLAVTAANDLGCSESERKVCCLKQGVAISLIDAATISSRPLYARLRALAQDGQIPWQLKQDSADAGDAGSFQRAAGARAVCTLSVPCRNLHSPSCVAAFADIEAQYRLVDAFLAAGGAF